MNNIYYEEGLADLSNFSEVKKEGNVKSIDSIGDCTIDILNQQNFGSFKKIYTPLFLRMLREEHFEAGYSNNLDELVKEIIDKDAMIASNWLSDIFTKHINSNKVLLALIFVISRVENKAIRPFLSVIAMASLSNKDIEIRETAIRCFENWGDFGSAECLKATNNDSISWIQEYKLQVIKDIDKGLNIK